MCNNVKSVVKQKQTLTKIESRLDSSTVDFRSLDMDLVMEPLSFLIYHRDRSSNDK